MGFLSRLLPFLRSEDEFDSYVVRQQDGITIVKPTQPPGYDETTRMIEYIAKNKLYRLRLWDFSNIPFPFTLDEIRELAATGRASMPEKNRFAVVVTDEVGYGTMRAFSVYRQQTGLTEVFVSSSVEEAMAWLKQGDLS